MDKVGLSKPNEAIWLGFGRIAEQYGLNELALALYQRVSDTPPSPPGSDFNLAQIREKIIHSEVNPTVSTAQRSN